MKTDNDDTENSAHQLFLNGYACSQSILLSYCERYGVDKEIAKKISSTFGGGMGRLRKTCGVLTGSYMVLGLAHGNDSPNDMDKKLHSYALVRELSRRFKEIHGETDCGLLLNKHSTEEDVVKRNHHRTICYRFVKDAVEILEDILNRESHDQKS